MSSAEPASKLTVERRTRQREAILHALDRAAGPLSPHQILLEAQEELPHLGIATVYRAVKDLTDDALLATVCLADGTARYELLKGHHHHFHCSECDHVYDIPADCSKAAVGLPRGFAVERHEVVLFGQCPACRKSRSRSGSACR
jgi:Fur family transcriptional regulator, ferric uptake regulator